MFEQLLVRLDQLENEDLLADEVQGDCLRRISGVYPFPWQHFQSILSLAPKKENWDLKREIQPRLTMLEKRTQKAVVDMLREKLEDKPTTGEGVLSAMERQRKLDEQEMDADE